MHKAQSVINHVALVLDASWSMKGRERSVEKALDEQIKYLASKSLEMNQETRVSVYRFGSQTQECLLFDMDVARLPSANELYSVLYENTALIDAVDKATSDLKTTSQLYGDHGFLLYILTDGQENDSRKSASHLKSLIQHSEDNWTYGFLVPDQHGVKEMMKFGALRDSIAVWDTTSAKGIEQSFAAIRTATDNYMTARASGVRGTRSVFSTGADAVNLQTVRSTLSPVLGVKKFDVPTDGRIDEFVRGRVGYYNAGMAFYQLTKTETIQPQKEVMVVDKSNGNVYGGAQARDLIGLPDYSTRVKPDYNPKYHIFVQSTSQNRKLLGGTKVLVKS